MFKFLKRLFVKAKEEEIKKSSPNKNDTIEKHSVTQSEEHSEEQNIPEVKYLIAGLGNIGPEYDETRHNIGFEIVDHLARKFDCQFKQDRLAYVAEFKFKGRTFILIKPTTFMNLSGKAVKYWMDQHKIKQENVLVALDDLSLPFGKLRLKKKGNPAGHNGLKDIDKYLGGGNYPRLKFGIGNNFPRGQQVKFVLGKWSNDEFAELSEFLVQTDGIIEAFGTIGIERAMNHYNKNSNKNSNKSSNKNSNENSTKNPKK